MKVTENASRIIPRYSGIYSGRLFYFVYGPITLLGGTFQNLPLSLQISHYGPATPAGKPTGLGCSPFARHYLGNHGCFLFLGVLRCFTSPRSLRRPMYSDAGLPVLPGRGCPIRRSPDQSVLAAPRGLSQLAASFIAFQCQGIHCMPFIS